VTAFCRDPSGLFNSSLDGNVRRAIDIHEGDKVDAAALKGSHPRCSGAQSQGQADLIKRDSKDESQTPELTLWRLASI
jgi:hypothetical protein